MALFTSVRGSFPWNPMRTQCAPSVGHGTGLFLGVSSLKTVWIMRQCTGTLGSYFCRATRKTKSRSASGALRPGLRLNMRLSTCRWSGCVGVIFP